MKQERILAVTAAVLGAAGFVLRLAEKQLFDPATGLPLSSPLHLLLPVFLLLSAAGLFLLFRRESFSPVEFEQRFPFADGGAVAAAVLGSTALLLAAASQLLSYWLLKELLLGILGLLMALTALGAFLTVWDLRRSRPVRGYLLLAGICLLALLLVVGYRAEAANSVLLSFYVQVLAQGALLLQQYHLAATVYTPEKSRPFAYFSALSVLLCFTAAADTGKVVGTVFYLAMGMLSLSFLLGRLPRQGKRLAAK